MTFGKKQTRILLLCAAALAFTAGPGPLPIAPAAYAASEVAAVVNKTAITTGDVAKRIAFLRLQRRKGDLKKIAREEMVDETLKRQEIARVGMSVSTDEVDAAFERFASSNKLSVQQLTGILNQAGVTADHFKAYIAVSMSWPRLVNARYGSRGKLSSQEVATRLLERKEKPVTTEYFLKQVIFVVPANKKGIVGKRKSEAEASRSKFPGCDQAMEFAKNYRDVSIRNLGRVLAPELPEEWKPLIEKAKDGTTGTRVTERGVEYLAICNQRQVSDDVAAEVVFRAEDLGKDKATDNPNAQKYLDDLRSKAQIVYR
ncbi:periplasmic chaperone for outer membrane proteins SurA [Ciceribacter lividus]|uniref:Periplasmic chaperone for outer membrane proteins SurA n=1 Tax=Ciceribacter lividus TaxID=1197950 RepID=A0A6I7HPH9_9HYPH|nr:SurA N-terminal domain-containing protein [Ciceribacter lividus]RCW27671.1 periplasmic chaperone for outer membrane proteins SurA [Ciceribacter lividus]